MSKAPLAASAIVSSLRSLNVNKKVQWKIIETASEQRLETNLKFKNFKATWAYLNEVKNHAHALKHHPTITTTYNKVNLQITTHDVGNKLTDVDFNLAQKLSDLLNEMK